MPASTTRVQLTLYASKLKNVAGAFKGTSDPFAVVTLLSNDSRDKPRVLGKTEVIKNSLSPQWTTVFSLDYELGKPLYLNIGVYDEVRKSRDKPMGSAQFEVGEILGARGNVKAKHLKRGGTLFARVERARSQDAGVLVLGLQGVKLKNVDGFFHGKSDPYFEIHRRIDEGGGYTWSCVYRSKHILNNLNPKWEPATMSVSLLCDGDFDQPIQIRVWDWEKSGKSKPMGNFETTLNGLLHTVNPDGSGDAKAVETGKSFELTNLKKRFGNIVVTHARVTGMSERFREKETPSSSVPVPYLTRASPAVLPLPYTPRTVAPTPREGSAPYLPQGKETSQPTFVDYISGGCELQMCVAIDFTGSNGDPRVPGTLHYIHPDGSLNDYEKALTAVGSIVGKYDSDQKFPVYGFGAKYGGIIRHCFQAGHSLEVQGISGILEAYRGVFKTPITMSGPTLFHEVIYNAAAEARQRQEGASRKGQQAYTILLILTDGAVSSVEGTRNAIVAASDAPLSIVIVGIGQADFSAMQFLDDFAGPGQRDICQFVEFNRHKHNKNSLTQATMEEIPSQLVDYFFNRGIVPMPLPSRSKVDVVADDYNEEQDIDLSLNIGEKEITLGGDATGLYVGTGSYGNIEPYMRLTVLPPARA